MSSHEPDHSIIAGPDPSANGSPLERLTDVEAALDSVTGLLEQLWVQRQMLYSAIRELKTIKRNVELAKARLLRGGK